jgi:serine/threonine-protein kinase
LASRIGRYRIVRRLAEDEAGVLYAAEDERERRHVHLRVLPEAIRHDPERRDRVLADGRALAGIDHPSLAALLDVGEAPEGLYLASEQAGGKTLRARFAEAPLDAAEALRIANEVASAVAALHRAGAIHGALDADRVAIDARGDVKVTGLGLAEVVRPMAGRSLDARSDVLAIGVLLHAMVSGKAVSAIDGTVRRALSLQASPDVPGKLAALVEMATDPDPDRRPKDADALSALLVRIDLPSEPVPDAVARNRRDVERGAPRAWIATASIVLAIVLGLAALLVLGR